MKLDPVYQAIEDRGNPNEVEKDGPIKCCLNAWLGDGYYFWDGFVDCAHWWGGHHLNNKYMICQASVEENDENYLDLFGNTTDMGLFSKSLALIKSELGRDDLTVSEAIAFLKEKTGFKKYTVIRAESPNCGSNLPCESVNYVRNNKSRLELRRMIQVCVCERGIVYGYKVIYPEDYVEEWVV